MGWIRLLVALLSGVLATAADAQGDALVPAANVERDAFGYPIYAPDWLGLRRQLKAGAFEDLDARLRELQDAFREDFRNEEVVRRTFAAFGDLTPALSRQVDAWVEARPDSPFAHLAAGRRDLGRAWRMRGEQTRAQTSDTQIALMKAEGERARLHLERAVAIDPTLVFGYEAQLMLARPLGDRALADRAVARALELQPLLFGVREEYLMGLTRRWGGSPEAMDAFARHAQDHVAGNPRLVVLLGMSSWDHGMDLHNQSRFAEAIASFDRGLAHGAHWRFLSARAFSHYYAGDYAKALADLDTVEGLSPGRPDVMHRRAHVLYFDGQTEAAYRAISAALALEPSDAHYASLRHDIFNRLRWEAFVANPTPGEATAYALAWMIRHAGWSLGGVFAVWCALLLWRRTRVHRHAGEDRPTSSRTADPLRLLPTGRLGAALWRGTVWVVILIHLGTFFAMRHAFSAMIWIDLAVTAVALAGTVAFIHGRRLFSETLWKVWAFFPLWVVFVDFHVQGFHLYEWPVWGFFHVIQLPVYAALFLYGYRSGEFWRAAETYLAPSGALEGTGLTGRGSP